MRCSRAISSPALAAFACCGSMAKCSSTARKSTLRTARRLTPWQRICRYAPNISAMRWKTHLSSPCWRRWSTADTGSSRTESTPCPVALRLPGLQTASTHILPGGATLTGPTIRTHTVPGLVNRYELPSVLPRRYCQRPRHPLHPVRFRLRT